VAVGTGFTEVVVAAGDVDLEFLVAFVVGEKRTETGSEEGRFAGGRGRIESEEASNGVDGEAAESREFGGFVNPAVDGDSPDARVRLVGDGGEEHDLFVRIDNGLAFGGGNGRSP
jgi:hypothetical protein